MMRTTTPILSLLIAVLIFVFFTHPQYTEVKKVQQEIAQYKTATETYEKFSNDLKEKLGEKTKRTEEEMRQLDVLVPGEIEETKHLVDLEAMAERNNLLFSVGTVNDKELSFTNPSTDEARESSSRGELESLDITFNVVGTYDQFKNFLKELERSLTIFEVTQINLAAEEGLFQRFGVTVRTYALPSE